MPLEAILAVNLAAALCLMGAVWATSLPLRDVSIIDIFWGAGFVLVAWLSLLLAGEPSARAAVVVGLVTAWGGRLSVYLAWRNWGKPEDKRYAKMRVRHGARFPLVSLATVFALQGALLWVISLPVQVGVATASGWSWLSTLGVLLWAVGLFFETVGDAQLARFKADPNNRGRVMNSGLWRYTRHPNYFGDFLVWWGLYLTALTPGTWWWTIVGPLLMSVLLLRVSGVTLLENSLKDRLDGYEDYKRRTSAFIPLPPRKKSVAS